MMWTYCFLAFIVFLIILIIYMFHHKKKKEISKPLRFVLWGIGFIALALLIVACLLPEFLAKQEHDEYFRISSSINNGKFEHILSDIDKLYPTSDELDSTKQSNRFILLRLYYEKTGNTKKEKKLLDDTKKNSSIMNDEIIKSIVDERLKELK